MKTEPYVRPMRNDWWLQRPAWRSYMLREVSSLFVILFCANLLIGLYALYQGEEAFNGWLAALRHPFSIIMNLVTLGLVLVHTVSWFNLAPQAMPMYIGDERVPDSRILAGNYAVFLVVSAIILWAI